MKLIGAIILGIDRDRATLVVSRVSPMVFSMKTHRGARKRTVLRFQRINLVQSTRTVNVIRALRPQFLIY